MTAGSTRAAWLTLLCLAGAIARAEPEQPTEVAQPAYEDRLIDGGNLSPDLTLGDLSRNPNGWSRSFRAEAITSRVTRDDVDLDESGLRINAMLDTLNFGALTLDANLRSSHGYSYGSNTGNLVTLYQFGMPMGHGWRVDNAIGVTNTPGVDLARTQQRFWVPSILNNGSSTEWRNAGGLQLHASLGRPGLLTGIYVPTFEELGGEQFSAGAQWNGAGQWSAAVQAVDVEDVRLGLGPLNSSRTFSGYSVLGALAWNAPDVRVQFNAVDSASDEQEYGSSVGSWIDAAIHHGRVRHTFGAFRFDENLFWGNQQLTSNHQGGYYRAAFQSQQWIIDGGLDYVTPVSGNSDDTVFATGYARYQVSSRLGIGGGANLRQSDGDAWSTFGFVDHTNRYGIGRFQADYATDELQDRASVTLNQTWNMPAGMRLGNSLIAGHEVFAGETTDTFGLAVNGGGDLRGGLSADVNARWDTATGDARSNNILANLALNWMFARGWTLGANYYISRNTWRVPLEITSPIDDLPIFEDQRINDQGYFLMLRHQWQAGSRAAPLAGVAGVGAGSIQGFLYMDENDNGRMDAGETGLPNVVVLLNGRFAARTNSEGRFEFPSVAAGSHVLSVVQDNIPLPWSMRDDGRTTIEVGVRDRTFVTLGAQRQR